MARKIDYNNKVITKVCDYLNKTSADFSIDRLAITINAEQSTVDDIFIALSKLVAGTKYTVQEDIQSYKIEVFNSSI